MPGTGLKSAQERIEREARVSGLRGFSTPTLEAVERRRLQLWVLAIVLGLHDVLDIILSSAVELLEGSGGSIMLAEGSDTLRAVCVIGNEAARGAVVKLGWGVAGQVALSKEPILLSGPADPEYFAHLI